MALSKMLDGNVRDKLKCSKFPILFGKRVSVLTLDFRSNMFDKSFRLITQKVELECAISKLIEGKGKIQKS